MRWVGIGGAVGAIVSLVVEWPGLLWALRQQHRLAIPNERQILYIALLVAAGMGMGGLVSRIRDKRWVGFAGLLGAVLGLVLSWPMMPGRHGILVTFDDPRHGAMMFAIALGLVGMGGVALVRRSGHLSGQTGEP